MYDYEETEFWVTAMSSLERVRQTLMTHMWPGMVRKTSAGPLRGLKYSDDEEDGGFEGEGEEGKEGEGKEESVEFPVTFASSSAPTVTKEERIRGEIFPGLDELRGQLPEKDDEDEPRINEEEYARLDEWLDEDGEEDFMGLAADDDQDVVFASGSEGEDVAEGSKSQSLEMSKDEEGDGFADDFDDFAPFQAPPTRTTVIGDGGDGLLSMDPTPLLLHLQTIRAELAGVEDEDERRIRAGREVERVMRGVGMDGSLGVDEWDDDGMDDLGGLGVGGLAGLGRT